MVGNNLRPVHGGGGRVGGEGGVGVGGGVGREVAKACVAILELVQATNKCLCHRTRPRRRLANSTSSFRHWPPNWCLPMAPFPLP